MSRCACRLCLSHDTCELQLWPEDGYLQGAASGQLTVGDTVLFLTIMQQLYGEKRCNTSGGVEIRVATGHSSELCPLQVLSIILVATIGTALASVMTVPPCSAVTTHAHSVHLQLDHHSLRMH